MVREYPRGLVWPSDPVIDGGALLPYEAVRSVQCKRRRNPTETQRFRREERVRRRLTVAGPRGARGEEGGAQEAGGGGACHQPGAVLGQQQDGTVGRGVPGERWGPDGHLSWGLEERPDVRRALAPRRRCPITTSTHQPSSRAANTTLKGCKHPLRVVTSRVLRRPIENLSSRPMWPKVLEAKSWGNCGHLYGVWGQEYTKKKLSVRET